MAGRLGDYSVSEAVVSEPSEPDPLETLRRWEESGGTWRLLHSHDEGVFLELLTCSGGEVMGHVRTDDPDVLAHVSRREGL